ncbi:MAG: sigma-70 family RNA polymerase sigma factor [Prevotella sp.]|nr:sigma-70 family RNA polymerase sigma factor [Prevotella sp.]
MKVISFQNDVLPLKNKLYRLALRITLNAEDAEDVVQETMMKVWSRRQQWEQIESMEAFCMTICRNLALDKTRRMAADDQSLEANEIDAPDHSHHANPEEQTIQQDRIRLVREIIDQLPEKQRSVMHLRDFEGKSYKEIATILSITEEQVKINIFRARQTVKSRFLQSEAFGI